MGPPGRVEHELHSTISAGPLWSTRLCKLHRDTCSRCGYVLHNSAEKTFSVQNAPATASGVSGLATASVDYAVLGLVAVAVVLGLVLLFWKRSPVKSS